MATWPMALNQILYLVYWYIYIVALKDDNSNLPPIVLPFKIPARISFLGLPGEDRNAHDATTAKPNNQHCQRLLRILVCNMYVNRLS